MISGMVELKSIVEERLKELKLKPVTAATSVGLERGFIRDIIAGRKKSVGADKIDLVAKALQMDPADLTSKSGGTGTPNARPATTSLPDRNTMNYDVPVFGTAAGSINGRGSFLISNEIIDKVARPPGIAQARGIYALYVDGDSMFPMFDHGALIFVNPHKPVRIGDAVVIQEPQSNNGESQAFVKVLKQVTSDKIVTEQYNPPCEIAFIKRDGITMHKVLTSNELYGV